MACTASSAITGDGPSAGEYQPGPDPMSTTGFEKGAARRPSAAPSSSEEGWRRSLNCWAVVS